MKSIEKITTFEKATNTADGAAYNTPRPQGEIRHASNSLEFELPKKVAVLTSKSQESKSGEEPNYMNDEFKSLNFTANLKE